MLLSKSQVKALVLFSFAHLDRMTDPKSPYYDPSFPKKVRLGQNRIGYPEAEVRKWVQGKIDQRDRPPPK